MRFSPKFQSLKVDVVIVISLLYNYPTSTNQVTHAVLYGLPRVQNLHFAFDFFSNLLYGQELYSQIHGHDHLKLRIEKVGFLMFFPSGA
jgi:hypothetical protein